jgi:hypothetical protein
MVPRLCCTLTGKRTDITLGIGDEAYTHPRAHPPTQPPTHTHHPHTDTDTDTQTHRYTRRHTHTLVCRHCWRSVSANWRATRWGWFISDLYAGWGSGCPQREGNSTSTGGSNGAAGARARPEHRTRGQRHTAGCAAATCAVHERVHTASAECTCNRSPATNPWKHPRAHRVHRHVHQLSSLNTSSGALVRRGRHDGQAAPPTSAVRLTEHVCTS